METNKKKQPVPYTENSTFSKELILPAVVRNWYWIALFAMLGLGLAFGFNKYFHGSYKSTLTLLLKNDPHQSPLNSTLDNLEIKEKTINIQDEQSIVSAYSLQLKTLQNLGWKTSLFKKLIIGKKDLYKNEPFRVLLPEGLQETQDIPLTIHMLSGGDYIAECDFHQRQGDTSIVIKFSDKGKFETPFNNQWFHFTLDSAGYSTLPDQGEDFVMVINNIPQMAIDYQTQLVVKISAPESDVLTVELKGPNVQRNVDYLNGLGETYRKFGLDQKNQSAINTLQFIRNQIAGVADSLQVSGNRFTEFRASNKVVDLSQEGTIILQKVEEVDRQENTLKLKINYYKELDKKMANGDDFKNFVAPSIGDPDPELNNLMQKLTQEFAQRESLSLTVQPRNPKLIAINNEIDLSKQLIKRTIAGLLSTAQFELNSLEQQRAQTNTKLTDIPQTERKFLDIKRGFDINSQLYNFLLQKRAEAGIALASNSPDAQILDAATPETTERIGLLPVVNLAIGLLAGTLLAFGSILLRQYTDNRLKDPRRVEQSLHLSVAGFIPQNRTSSELPVTEYPNSQITESFRSLRSNLRYLLAEHSNAIIALHSVSPAEGKSFVAANLSAILSLSGKKVLLVDLDKKTSHLKNLTGAGPARDLSEFLKGAAGFGDVVSKTKVPDLSFAQAAQADNRLAELMDSPKMSEFVSQAKTSFDYIVFDNPPIGILSDAKTIAAWADVNLFVLRLGFSSNKELAFINRTADEETIRNMIVVLNEVSHSISGDAGKSNYFNESRVTSI